MLFITSHITSVQASWLTTGDCRWLNEMGVHYSFSNFTKMAPNTSEEFFFLV